MNVPLAALLFGAAGTCLAQSATTAPAPPAGIVKRVSGEVLLLRGQLAAQALQVGQAMQPGDTVRTGRDGHAGITLADDTLLAAGPESELVIQAFDFDPTTHDGSVWLQLWRGTLRMITGLIAKKSPEKVNVETRSVVLGVRGTDVIVESAGLQGRLR